jgi:putative addiction module component (TIGR02574 family)
MGVDPADLAGLTVDEKRDLISAPWDSIEASAEVPTLTETQARELERRRIRGLSEPDAMIDWSVVRQDLRKRP